MKFRISRLFIGILMSCVCVTASHAQEQPASEAEVFQDWRLACDQGQPCRIAQTVVEYPARRLILQVKVFRGETPTMLLTFPLGILLSTGWQYEIDGRSKTVLPFEICNSEGCHAGVRLTPRLLAALRRGQTLSVTFHDADQNNVSPQISLMGFTKAYEALE